MEIKEKVSDWRKKIHFRRRVRFLIVAAVFLAAYITLFILGVHFNGMDTRNAGFIAGLAALGLIVYLTDVPVHTVFRVLIGLALPACLFLLVEQYTHELSTLVENAWKLNFFLYYLLFIVLFFVFGRISTACFIEVFAVGFFTIANYFVLYFRSTPLVPWDFYAIDTAMSVAGSQSFSITWPFAVITAHLLTMLLISLRLGVHLRKWPVRLVGGGIAVVVMCFLLNYLWDPDTPDKEGLNKSLFKTTNMYKKNGAVLSFTINLRYLSLDAPEGYSAEEAKAILDAQDADISEIPAELAEDLPNIIVIMSETFSDPAVNGSFKTNKDYMPFIRSLLDGAENTVSGYLYVSVLGGGTANSEFEFLSGSSVQFFPPGSVVYQQYLHKKVLTVVDSFNEWDYATHAMHPYRAAGWNRNKVYPLMGFDDMKFMTDITYRQKLRTYISDEADYNNILEDIENTEEPLFMHNITMQNHSAYGGEYDNFSPQIYAVFNRTNSNKYLNHYLSLLYETDIATEAFIKALEESDEKTVVCFFGDHQPNDYVVKPIFKENKLDIDNLTLAQDQKRHMTPFFIWANYDIEEASGIEISANYLCNLLLETVGLPKNAYQTYLDTVRETFPVFNAIGYFDADGNCKDYSEMTEEEQKVYDTYEKVQWYRIYDQVKDLEKEASN